MTTLTAPHPYESLMLEMMGMDEKAEIINGRIVKMAQTGRKAMLAAKRIAFALDIFAEEIGEGEATTDGGAFFCDLPNRGSFAPDAAFYNGPLPEDDRDFYPEPPVFAVEVRSKNDYGPKAERAIRAKIADYFAAGALVVWDVDLENEEVIAKYSGENPNEPQIFRRGEIADAEPAVPNWTMNVDALFGRNS